MKSYLLFLFTLMFLWSCSSSTETPKVSSNEETVQNSRMQSKSRVEFRNADGTVTPVKFPGSHQAAMVDPKTGKQIISDGWVDSSNYSPYAGKHLRELSEDELAGRIKTASAQETSLIIEELKSRREKGVKGLVLILSDTRKTVFPKGREYWWYEKKGADAEAIELRVYAAFTLQFITNKYPSGVVMKMFDDRLIFAAKGKFAVVKEDVAKVWLQWWEQAKNDY